MAQTNTVQALSSDPVKDRYIFNKKNYYVKLITSFLYALRMLLKRLSGRKVCERVKTKGSLWKGRHLYARIIKGAPRLIPLTAAPAIYVGTLTSAKLDKSAVKRNRMRRRCREALRVTLQQYVGNFTSNQLLLLPRSSSLSADFNEILVDVSNLIRTLSSHG